MAEEKRGSFTPVLIIVIVAVAVAGFVAGRMTAKPVSQEMSGETNIAGDSQVKERTGSAARMIETKADDERQLEAKKLKAGLMAMKLANKAQANENPQGYDPEQVGEDVPVEWPANTPDLFREDEFKRVFKEIVAEGKMQAEIVGTDCEEAPCVAMLRLSDEEGEGMVFSEHLFNSDSWKENWGNIGISLRQTEVECEDGSKELIALVGVPWKDWDDKTKFHQMKRNLKRTDDMVAKWKCRQDGK